MDRLAKAPINLYYETNKVKTILENFDPLESVTSDGIVNQLGQVINGNAPIKENTDCAGAGGSHGGNGGYGGI